MSRQTAGAIGSVTLLAAAAGGLFFGVVADRYGRTRALMASVLIYSVFTAACGLAHDGAAARGLPHSARHRHGRRVGERRGARVRDVAGRASRQGARIHAERVGDRLSAAAAVTMIVLPRWGWRVVFFVGVLPAFLTFWVRRHVREPELWLSTRGTTRARSRLRRRVPRRPCAA